MGYGLRGGVDVEEVIREVLRNHGLSTNRVNEITVDLISVLKRELKTGAKDITEPLNEYKEVKE
jgi:hypothetical protein